MTNAERVQLHRRPLIKGNISVADCTPLSIAYTLNDFSAAMGDVAKKCRGCGEK